MAGCFETLEKLLPFLYRVRALLLQMTYSLVITNFAAVSDAPLKPSKCYKCGDLDQQLPCEDSNYTLRFDFGQQCQPYCDHLHIEVFENVPLACPDHSPYCMTDIFHRNGSKATVYRRCVNEDTCRSEWYLQTSSKPECTTQFDPNINSDLECHLCCYGDGCNTGYVPPAQTLYTP
ncbi:hypothetical protein BaRGS_00027928 [Batillaria attramentaria]|uniref:Uncharacterized protein n=1 Tax=Batillaria attramentaria TaxID=370345 RepID=A0ABD0K1V4_9CAEN